jgi:hypothetical protein
MTVSKCIFFFFTCSIKISRSEKFYDAGISWAAPSSLLQSSLLWSWIQASNFVSCLRSMRKMGGNVGSCIRCVFPWERCLLSLDMSRLSWMLCLWEPAKGVTPLKVTHPQPLGQLDNARERQPVSHRDQR